MIDFKRPTAFNRFLVEEDISLGQRVKKFTLEALIDGQWQPLKDQLVEQDDGLTTIGHRRIICFPTIKATKLRFTVTDTKAEPVIKKIGLYLAPDLTADIPNSGEKYASSLHIFFSNPKQMLIDWDSEQTFTSFRDLRNHNSQPINLVVPSVRTIDLMAGRLARQLMLDSTTIATKFHDPETWKALGYNKETFPALFIPNTYEIYWETSIDKLIERLAEENAAFWNADRTALAKQIGLSKNEVVTLASIVDSETANNGEKARIAGLYMNRLHRGILLQSDPTVIFAVGDFTIRRVLNVHLQTPLPYNTYRVAGLPPDPIRIPSIAGIDAVLNYEHNDYIYMCAKEDFSGTHNFAVNYSDHLANARRYINALNQRGIK